MFCKKLNDCKNKTMKRIYLLLIVFIFLANNIFSQSYDIVIKGGHVIDAKNNIDALMDVAIKDGKIVTEQFFM